jgi:predicted  nucleic acid-binding Zn-ribbon protein
MASSSGNKPTMEERIAELEGNVQKLRNQLINLDDFLQNLDSEAGRRMEMLENDNPKQISTNPQITHYVLKIRNKITPITTRFDLDAF